MLFRVDSHGAWKRIERSFEKFQDETANFKIGFAVLPCFANALLFFDPLWSGEEGLPEFGEEGTS